MVFQQFSILITLIVIVIKYSIKLNFNFLEFILIIFNQDRQPFIFIILNPFLIEFFFTLIIQLFLYFFYHFI
jgi:hypothetical protein